MSDINSNKVPVALKLQRQTNSPEDVLALHNYITNKQCVNNISNDKMIFEVNKNMVKDDNLCEIKKMDKTDSRKVS
jgi:nitrous oxide reductase